MTCRAQASPVSEPLRHDLSFSDPLAPVGFARCLACGYYVNEGWWATEECPGPKKKEER